MTQIASPENVFTAADELFEDIDYKRSLHRSISGTLLDEFDRPLIPVTVSDRINSDRIRSVGVNLTYLLSDGSRADQSVDYELTSSNEEPTVTHAVYFGDTWGREVPFRPFFEQAESPLVIMKKVIETVRERRMQTNSRQRDNAWRVNSWY